MSDIVEVLNEIVERHDCSHPAIVSKASAEITRLTAEIEKLKADLAFADAQCAKVEGLFLGTHKENEKLRSMLMDVVECWDWWQEDTEDHCLSVPRGAVEAARTEIFGGKK